MRALLFCTRSGGERYVATGVRSRAVQSGLNGQRPSSGRRDTKRGISSVESPVDAPAVSSLIMGEYLAGYWQSPANGRCTRLKETEKMSLDRTQCCVEGGGCYLLVLAHVKESLKYMPTVAL